MPLSESVEGGCGGRRNAGRVFVAVSYTYLGGGVQPPGCRRLRVLVFNLFVVMRVSVYVIMVVRARLQAGGASFSVGELHCAMLALVRTPPAGENSERGSVHTLHPLLFFVASYNNVYLRLVAVTPRLQNNSTAKDYSEFHNAV